MKPNGAAPITVRDSATANVLIYPPVGAAFDGLKVNQPAAVEGAGGFDTFVCIAPTRCVL